VSQVGFYHLTHTDVYGALPALLGRTLASGEKAVVVCPDEIVLKALDEGLWGVEWLPHGTMATPHPEWQPVFLTLGEDNPAGAKFLFRVNGAGGQTDGFVRVFDLFDGNDEAAVMAARGRWRVEKAAGHELAYWKQEETGWVKAG
jgi:DNA polymerase-3 subunit chi